MILPFEMVHKKHTYLERRVPFILDIPVRSSCFMVTGLSSINGTLLSYGPLSLIHHYKPVTHLPSLFNT